MAPAATTTTTTANGDPTGVGALFNAVYRGGGAAERCARQLWRLLGERGPEGSAERLVACVEQLLSVDVKSAGTERCVRFLGTVAQRMPNALDCPERGDDNDDDDDPRAQAALEALLSSLADGVGAADRTVRLRSCQALAGVLERLPEGAGLTEEAAEDLTTRLIERLSLDRAAPVRAAAARALTRLAVPDEETGGYGEDRAALAYADAARGDRAKDVRAAAVASLPLAQDTLPLLLERLRDVAPQVRRAAVARMSQVAVRALTIRQRAALMGSALRDRDAAVRGAALGVLRRWYEADARGDAPALVGAFDPATYPREAALAAEALMDGEAAAEVAAAAAAAQAQAQAQAQAAMRGDNGAAGADGDDEEDDDAAARRAAAAGGAASAAAEAASRAAAAAAARAATPAVDCVQWARAAVARRRSLRHLAEGTAPLPLLLGAGEAVVWRAACERLQGDARRRGLAAASTAGATAAVAAAAAADRHDALEEALPATAEDLVALAAAHARAGPAHRVAATELLRIAARCWDWGDVASCRAAAAPLAALVAELDPCGEAEAGCVGPDEHAQPHRSYHGGARARARGVVAAGGGGAGTDEYAADGGDDALPLAGNNGDGALEAALVELLLAVHGGSPDAFAAAVLASLAQAVQAWGLLERQFDASVDEETDSDGAARWRQVLEYACLALRALPPRSAARVDAALARRARDEGGAALTLGELWRGLLLPAVRHPHPSVRARAVEGAALYALVAGGNGSGGIVGGGARPSSAALADANNPTATAALLAARLLSSRDAPVVLRAAARALCDLALALGPPAVDAVLCSAAAASEAGAAATGPRGGGVLATLVGAMHAALARAAGLGGEGEGEAEAAAALLGDLGEGAAKLLLHERLWAPGGAASMAPPAPAASSAAAALHGAAPPPAAAPSEHDASATAALAALLVLQFHPGAAQASAMRQCLSVFFEVYAQGHIAHKRRLAAALLPAAQAALAAAVSTAAGGGVGAARSRPAASSSAVTPARLAPAVVRYALQLLQLPLAAREGSGGGGGEEAMARGGRAAAAAAAEADAEAAEDEEQATQATATAATNNNDLDMDDDDADDANDNDDDCGYGRLAERLLWEAAEAWSRRAAGVLGGRAAPAPVARAYAAALLSAASSLRLRPRHSRAHVLRALADRCAEAVRVDATLAKALAAFSSGSGPLPRLEAAAAAAAPALSDAELSDLVHYLEAARVEDSGIAAAVAGGGGGGGGGAGGARQRAAAAPPRAAAASRGGRGRRHSTTTTESSAEDDDDDDDESGNGSDEGEWAGRNAAAPAAAAGGDDGGGDTEELPNEDEDGAENAVAPAPAPPRRRAAAPLRGAAGAGANGNSMSVGAAVAADAMAKAAARARRGGAAAGGGH
jgi:hypothetical protein